MRICKEAFALGQSSTFAAYSRQQIRQNHDEGNVPADCDIPRLPDSPSLPVDPADADNGGLNRNNGSHCWNRDDTREGRCTRKEENFFPGPAPNPGLFQRTEQQVS